LENLYLENNELKISLSPQGAELQSIIRKSNKSEEQEYLWQGAPEYWARRAPILFPIVGKLRNNEYHYKGESYFLPQHGFARDYLFEVLDQSDSAISFLLRQTENSVKIYPFDFHLLVNYSLNEEHLLTTYEVTNYGHEAMPFSIGGHPAFDLQKEKGAKAEDFYLYFEKDEQPKAYSLKDGLLEREPTRSLPFEGELLPISPSLFEDDAIVFKNIKSDFVALKKRGSEYEVKLESKNLPWLGIWGKGDLPFLCLEPWQGHADFINHNHNILEKDGVITLDPSQVWSASYKLSFG
jgi:galactose mutarotase-like enzyme